MRTAVLALQRRRAWSVFGAAAAGMAALLMAWLLWHFWETAWSLPLVTPLTQVHFPKQVFNEGMMLNPPRNLPVIALQLLAFLCGLLTLLLRRGYDGRHRFIVTITGAGCAVLMLAFAWLLQLDTRENGAMRRLADEGQFAELERLTKRRPGMPYGRYIGAQALLLAGKGAQLRAAYGPWLQEMAQQAERQGYRGRPGQLAYRDVPYWQGMDASPRVMRELEIAAFGSGISVFSSEYEHKVRQDTLKALRYGPVAAVLLLLFTLGSALFALHARSLTQRIADVRARELQDELLAVEVARYRPPPELPPLEMDPEQSTP
jgi:hypothetical protein